MDRVIGQSGSGPGIVTVREYEELVRGNFFGSKGSSPRIILGILNARRPELALIAHQVSRELKIHSDHVMIIDFPDVKAHIRNANMFNAHLYVGLNCVEVTDNYEHVVAYYETPTYISQGGKSLAEGIVHEFGQSSVIAPRLVGMRLAVLRETRMPAVVCTIGDCSAIIQYPKTYAEYLAKAIGKWVSAVMAGSPDASVAPVN